MKTTALATTAKSMLAKTKFWAKRNSPEIFVVAGIVGTVVSTVMACKATPKAEKVLDKAKDDLEKARALKEEPQPSNTEAIVPVDPRKAIVSVYAKTGLELAKLYAPSVGLGVLSITSILTSHDIMRKRNISLAAAYATVDKGFKEYRGRVVDRYGEDVDRQLKYNLKQETIEETEVNEKGKEKQVQKQIDVVEEIPTYSEYARFFDESSSYWEKSAEYNLGFLRIKQNIANNLLQANGYLFLNDVYDMLDIPRTKAGQSVGWVYSKEHPSYVDFGIFESYKKNRDFVNGYERVILLDFNVDGDILSIFSQYFRN